MVPVSAAGLGVGAEGNDLIGAREIDGARRQRHLFAFRKKRVHQNSLHFSLSAVLPFAR